MNFFWRGNNFDFLENITIKSHIKVGHKPIVWLSGDPPNSRFWREIKNLIMIKDAKEFCDVENFISLGGNLRTAADLWRFNFLDKQGGLYCDCDAFALKKFPNNDWIVCSERKDNSVLSIGVLKSPPNQKIFKNCISKIEKDWGNVEIFTNEYQKQFGNIDSTHDNLLFYPYEWRNCQILLQEVDIPKHAYSIHFYTMALQRYLINNQPKGLKKIFKFNNLKNVKNLNEKWCKKNSNTLLGKIWSWLNDI